MMPAHCAASPMKKRRLAESQLEDGTALFTDVFNAKPSLDDKAASSRVAMQLYWHNG